MDAAVEAARREVDAKELAQIPKAKLEPLFLDLGLITCDVKRDIVLTNTGEVSIFQLKIDFLSCPSVYEGIAPKLICHCHSMHASIHGVCCHLFVAG